MVAAAFGATPEGRNGTFAISPKMLQELAFSMAKSGRGIYGAAIAFAPGIVQIDTFDDGRHGLEEGVRREANGYGAGQTGSKAVRGSKLTELALATSDRFAGKTIYCPYAFNCSCRRNSDESCSSMDLATAYDYSDPSTSWFFEPMRLFEEQKAKGLVSSRSFPAIWTEPYFDQGAGSINMTTFSVAFGTDQENDESPCEFLGVCTLDVAVESLCWTNCSNEPVQPTMVTAALATAHRLSVKMKKPTSQPVPVVMTVQATGEHTIQVQFNLSMVWSKASSFVGPSPHEPVEEEWTSLDTQQMSLAGYQLNWAGTPPSNDSVFNLARSSKRFTETKEYALQLLFDCNGLQPCIADGDTIETVIAIASAGSSGSPSEVRIVTELEAVLSCEKTKTWIDVNPESVPMSSPIGVRLHAIDVDGMPINWTQSHIEFRFGNQLLPIIWNRGSNVYVTAISAELTAQPGLYELVVSASGAWSELLGRVMSCELLRLTVRVEEGFGSKWLLAGAAIVSVAALGVLALLVRKRHAHLKALLPMLFSEVTELVGSLCLEVGAAHIAGLNCCYVATL
jgi:hypothetical protein